MRLPLLLTGSLVAAALVSPASSSPAPPTEGCGGTFSPAQADRVVRASDVTLQVSAEWSSSENRVTWNLALRNRTGKRLLLTFPTLQYADVALTLRGRAVYWWSRGKGFGQAIMYRTLAPHETYACSLSPSTLDINGLENGRYELVAWLKLYPYGRNVVARYPLSITNG